MPNYTRNIIKMKGIAEFPLFDEDGCFDFNKIIPMPEELKDTNSGTFTEKCIACFLTEKGSIGLNELNKRKKEINEILGSIVYHFNESDFVELIHEILAEDNDLDAMYEEGRKYVENYRKYGACTWYEWACQNWSTKWNACDTEIVDEDTIKFSTAWCSPMRILFELSNMYPDAEIETWYAGEEIGYEDGYRIFKNGVIIKGNIDKDMPPMSQEAYETYVKCWGVSNCLYKDTDGYWKKHDCENCNGCNW